MLYPKVLRELATKEAELGASREERRDSRELVLAPSTCPGSTCSIDINTINIIIIININITDTINIITITS